MQPDEYLRIVVQLRPTNWRPTYTDQTRQFLQTAILHRKNNGSPGLWLAPRLSRLRNRMEFVFFFLIAPQSSFKRQFGSFRNVLCSSFARELVARSIPAAAAGRCKLDLGAADQTVQRLGPGGGRLFQVTSAVVIFLCCRIASSPKIVFASQAGKR